MVDNRWYRKVNSRLPNVTQYMYTCTHKQIERTHVFTFQQIERTYLRSNPPAYPSKNNCFSIDFNTFSWQFCNSAFYYYFLCSPQHKQTALTIFKIRWLYRFIYASGPDLNQFTGTIVCGLHQELCSVAKYGLRACSCVLLTSIGTILHSAVYPTGVLVSVGLLIILISEEQPVTC
jgi:hypothetical protein